MMYDIEADWTLNLLCNYDCAYCSSHASKERPGVGRLTHEQCARFFDWTGKTWLLHLSGGEPFLYPDFIGLCRALTARHYISLNSNLSSARVRDFAAAIDPSRVQYLHCGVHLDERDRKQGWSDLLSKAALLHSQGFPLFASMVMTPPAFADFPRAAERLAGAGVALIPKAIRGRYRGQWYPQAYNETQRAQFRRFSEQAQAAAKTGNGHRPTIDPLVDRDHLNGFPDFTGTSCAAGRLSVAIGLDGTIRRCGPKTALGSIRERRFAPLAADRPCDDECCPYWCLRYSRFVSGGSGGYPRREAPSVLREKLAVIRRLPGKIANRLAG